MPSRLPYTAHGFSLLLLLLPVTSLSPVGPNQPFSHDGGPCHAPRTSRASITTHPPPASRAHTSRAQTTPTHLQGIHHAKGPHDHPALPRRLCRQQQHRDAQHKHDQQLQQVRRCCAPPKLLVAPLLPRQRGVLHLQAQRGTAGPSGSARTSHTAGAHQVVSKPFRIPRGSTPSPQSLEAALCQLQGTARGLGPTRPAGRLAGWQLRLHWTWCSARQLLPAPGPPACCLRAGRHGRAAPPTSSGRRKK